ncbi:hypothetical protein MHF_0562 [Mycoplasma haemofelis Ohio2]|uniref:Uncharacterized protein n=1 Tax=Mycoplasma haemofelis (strain Ohio2) TaxID=859194 RepID=F6FHY6_MYCHI|nr:hypothetical protein MHF_0562 [Mycoplasma haemofelis Ohio2]
MSKSLALSLGTLGVGGVGLGAAGIHHFRKGDSASEVTFRTKYSKALISESDDATWTAKLGVLEKSSLTPKNAHLVKAKGEKDKGKLALKEGCMEIYSRPVDSVDDFNDFKNFCSFNNGDKIADGKELANAESDFSSHWEAFNKISKEDLHFALREAYDIKGNSADASGWKAKMLEKCKEISSDIFDGSISNFDTFCVKNKSVAASSGGGRQ